MADYKAEFFSHYYERRLRPRHAYSTGLIGRWAGWAGAVPTISNLMTQTPLLGDLAKRVAGIARERSLPRFATRPFRRWFERRAGTKRASDRGAPAPAHPTGAGDTRRRVLFWADTFSNFFHPEHAIAAVEVLETAGCEVSIPVRRLCCGRPLYDHGFLDLARWELGRILDVLAPDIVAGTPVVGIEPTCIAVFRDELARLFPDDERARKLAANVFTLAEWLERIGFDPPRREGRALFHGHCHQKALWGTSAEVKLLARMGLSVAAPDTGCCGMAGSFGFHPERVALSLRIGEHALFPAVRAADADTCIVSNGYSCREQFVAGTGRAPTHFATLLRDALAAESGVAPGRGSAIVGVRAETMPPRGA
jgi:Fe-S oxidoreductase